MWASGGVQARGARAYAEAEVAALALRAAAEERAREDLRADLETKLHAETSHRKQVNSQTGAVSLQTGAVNSQTETGAVSSQTGAVRSAARADTPSDPQSDSLSGACSPWQALEMAAAEVEARGAEEHRARCAGLEQLHHDLTARLAADHRAADGDRKSLAADLDSKCRQVRSSDPLSDVLFDRPPRRLARLRECRRVRFSDPFSELEFGSERTPPES